MKLLLIAAFLLLENAVFAQKIPFYGFDKVRIIDSDKVIQAEIKPLNSDPHVNSKYNYYWYDANQIHITQGGFSGKLLDGLYAAYYRNKNLEEQGNFKKGLKTGVWKKWRADGSLESTTQWNHGLLIPDNRPPVWKRIKFFKWKWHKAKSDSLKTAH